MEPQSKIESLAGVGNTIIKAIHSRVSIFWINYLIICQKGHRQVKRLAFARFNNRRGAVLRNVGASQLIGGIGPGSVKSQATKDNDATSRHDRRYSRFSSCIADPISGSWI